jgi:hypothetical protein
LKELESYISRLKKIDERIANRTTGTAKEFARSIGVCERTLYDYISVLKSLIKVFGVTIIYNTDLKSYQYSRLGKLEISYKWINSE